MSKKLVLAVIDGLTPALLEKGIASGRLPTLTALREAGEYTRATTTFPSVTPVCLTSIATGAHPDVHHVPHLVWYHRGERRLVEYGSSFPAMRAASSANCAGSNTSAASADTRAVRSMRCREGPSTAPNINRKIIPPAACARATNDRPRRKADSRSGVMRQPVSCINGRARPGPARLLLAVPPFQLFRYPSKYLLAAAFCLAVLAAFGMDRALELRQSLPRVRRITIWGVVAVLLATCLLAALARFAADPRWKPADPFKARPWTDDYTNLAGALYRRLRETFTWLP